MIELDEQVICSECGAAVSIVTATTAEVYCDESKDDSFVYDFAVCTQCGDIQRLR